MNNGAFGENFPYSNFHDLNMDWIIKIAKDFLDQYTHIQEIIDNGEESLNNTITEGLNSLDTKAQELSEALQDWYDEHSADISNELSTALQTLSNSLTTSLNTFNTRAEIKAAETIATIPSDYTELANSVSAVYDYISLMQTEPKNILFSSGVINTGEVGDTITLSVTPNQYYGHAVINVSNGDVVKIIAGNGGAGARLWCVTDTNLRVLSVATAGETAYNKEIHAEQDGYIILNVNNSTPIPSATYQKFLSLADIENDIIGYTEYIARNNTTTDVYNIDFNFQNEKTIATNVEYYQPINPIPSINSQYTTMIIPCKIFDKFYITGSGALNALLWAFTDENYKLLSKSETNVTEKDKMLVAPADGYFVYNSALSAEHHVYTLNTSYVNKYFKNKSFDYIENKCVQTNYASGTNLVITESDLAEGAYCIIPVVRGDKIYHVGRGFDLYRAWCFVDENNKIISVSESNISVNEILTAPTTGKLILNVRKEQGWYTGISKTLTSKNIITEMNGGTKYQFLPPIIPDSYDPTPNSYSAITNIINVETPSVNQIYALYNDLMAAYPDYISRETLPYTDQSGSYNMYVYSFTPPTIPFNTGNEPRFPLSQLPTIIMAGGVHGEGLSGDDPAMLGATYYFLKDMCENWKTNKALQYLRWNTRILYIPLQNPWGFENKSRKNSRGVDINRNMPFGWLYKNDPTAIDYAGETPLSENESKNIKYVIDNNPNAVMFMDIHSRVGNVDPTRMMYFTTLDYSPFLNVYRSIIPYISTRWQELDNTISGTNGFVQAFGTGIGMASNYASSKGIAGTVIEGFSKHSATLAPAYGTEMTRMLLIYFGTFIMQSLRLFKDNYYPEASRQVL